MIHLVTYATDDMSRSLDLCKSSAKKNGVDFVFNHKKIDGFFYLLNADVLDQKRGAGYWLWKPYIIAEAMTWMSEGDYLIYADAGVEFINDVRHIIHAMDSDVFLFGNNWRHLDWCKKMVFDTMLPDMKSTESRQAQASVIFFRLSKQSIDFVKEWLVWCQMPGFIDDTPMEGNEATFSDHRHDQAILTNMALKYGYGLHWWPASYNKGQFVYDKNGFNDNYPVMFNHHRKRNSEW